MLASCSAAKYLSVRTLTRSPIPHRIPFRRWKQISSEPGHSRLTASLDPESNTPAKLSQSLGVDPSDKSTEVKPLTKLSRPLGVKSKPSAEPQSWEEKRAELLDYDKHIERRRHLVKEATRGYFQDYHALRNHEGKTWIAPNSLIREDQALYYPDVTGISLTPQENVHTTTIMKGRISIVAMISTTRSEEHVKSFITRALEAHQWNPLFQFVQINLQENPLKGFLVSLFMSSIRERTPAHLQSTYLISRQNMEYLREPMGMINKHIGYIYLVDENCKIRWAGCSYATEEEDTWLSNCTRVLLRRLSKTEDVVKDSRSTAAESLPISSSE